MVIRNVIKSKEYQEYVFISKMVCNDENVRDVESTKKQTNREKHNTKHTDVEKRKGKKSKSR